MAITPTDFRVRFPEFSDLTEFPDVRVQLFIDDAICDIGTDEDHWCGACRYDRALSYLTAHMLTAGTVTESGNTSANAGPIINKTAGSVSVGRAVVAKSRSDGDDWLTTTAYGQQFLRIRSQCFSGILVAIC